MPEDTGDLVHIALFYRGDTEYLDTVVPFIRAGLDVGEPVVVAVPTGKLELLREALGDDAPRISLADMAEVGRNPARTFPYLSRVGGPSGRARIVAEPIWPGRSAESYPACVQNEALFNAAFAGKPLITLCPYDAAGLDAGVLADARTTHPTIREGALTVDSDEFSAWEALARYNLPLPVDPTAVTFTVRALDQLTDARTFVARYAESAGLAAKAIGDLQLIATELATNSLQYSDGDCTLALWPSADQLVCQVNDAGRLDDPLAGRRLPGERSVGGRGLFLVNALADLVLTHTSEAGTVIRAYLRLDRVRGVDNGVEHAGGTA